MNNYVENNLRENEQIIADVKRSNMLLLGELISTVIKIVFWCAVGIATLRFVPTPILGVIPFIFVLFPIIGFVCSYLRFHREKLTLTDERLIFRTGIFSTTSVDIPYEQVEQVEVRQNFWGKIFHYSQLVVSTGSSGESIKGVIEGDSIKNTIVTQADTKKKKAAQEQAMATAMAMREALGGGMPNPYMNQQNPYMNQQNPYANQQNPYANQQNPYANQQNPYANQQNPYANQQNPYANQQNPYANQQNPYANQQNPYMNQQTPYANQQNPYANRQNPYANQQNPYAPQQQNAYAPQQAPAAEQQAPSAAPQAPSNNQQ